MKRILIMTMALLGMVGKAGADDVTVSDVSVPLGGQATLEIGFNINSGKIYTGCQFDLSLPTGVETFKDEANTPMVKKGGALSDHTITPGVVSSGDDRYVVVSFTKAPFVGTSGIVLSVTLNADANLSVGDQFIASVKNITFTTTDVENIPFDDVNFNITVSEPVGPVILDETSTTVPEASDGVVDIKVKRTINANEWSTIVLPFDMTAEQVKSVFGSDVKLAEFVDYEAEYDEDDNVTGLAVNFENVDLSEEGFYANYPYLIKVTSDITEFDVTAEIDPDEESAVAEYDNGKKGKQREVYGSFIGTYHAGNYIPANDLFLSGNKFYYSVGKTKIKAFRAYLWLDDVLASVSGEAPVRIAINDETTRIADIENDQILDGVYTLQGVDLGQKDVQSLPKGIYIVNGKKVSVK